MHNKGINCARNKTRAGRHEAAPVILVVKKIQKTHYIKQPEEKK